MYNEKQAFRHDPNNGVFGDCYRTCLAALLNLPRDDVPHYVTTMDVVEWETEVKQKMDAWLVKRGFQELAIPVTGDLEGVLALQKTRTHSPVPAMLTGESRTGCNHVVVIFDGEIVYDPSLNSSGIIGPCDDGYFWLTWLIRVERCGPVKWR